MDQGLNKMHLDMSTPQEPELNPIHVWTTGACATSARVYITGACVAPGRKYVPL
jgi:hypothetical protein